MTARPLAITMGDPAGIGPEIIVKAAAELQPRLERGDLRLLVIGSNAALEQARARFAPELTLAAVAEDDTAWPALWRLAGWTRGRTDPAGRAVGRRWPLRLPGGRARRPPGDGRPDRRHRHRAAEQGGAEQGRLPLSRPYRDAGGADRRERLLHDAGARQHAGQPRDHPYRAGGRAEARYGRTAAAGDRADA